MSFVRLDCQPDSILVQMEDSDYRFEEPAQRKASPVHVEYIPHERGGRVVVHPCKTPIKRVKLRWHANLSDVRLVLGDAWERSSGNHYWNVMIAERPMPWYFLTNTGDRTDGYGVMTDCNAMCLWQADPYGITLWLDVRSGGDGVLLREPLQAATVVTRQGTREESPFAAAQVFCEMMCPKPVLPDSPVFGMNNWYTCYGVMSRESVLRETEYLREMTRDAQGTPYMVLDDGWQAVRFRDSVSYFNGGPWKNASASMGDMAELCADIRGMGALPGVWFRPLATAELLPEAFFLNTPPSRKQVVGRRLDPSHPEALEIVRSDVRRLTAWGFRLIKHDFSTNDLAGEAMQPDGWHFYDRSLTTAQVVRALYSTIQEAGSGALVIGCNTYNHITAGIHAMQRVGDDTSGRSWEWTRRNGVNAMMRLPQNGRFFLNDPDCAAFTDKVPAKLNLQFMEACALTGSALFASVIPGILTADEMREIRRVYRLSSLGGSGAAPADWMKTSSPTRYVEAGGTEHTYDWYDAYEGARLHLNWYA